MRIAADRLASACKMPSGKLGKWAYVSPEVLAIIEKREGREFEAMGLRREKV